MLLVSRISGSHDNIFNMLRNCLTIFCSNDLISHSCEGCLKVPASPYLDYGLDGSEVVSDTHFHSD